jgi:hypothetical protein
MPLPLSSASREVTRLEGFSDLSIAIAVIGDGPVTSGVAGMSYGTIGPFQAIYHHLSSKWRRDSSAV